MQNKIERIDSELMRELSSIIIYELKDPRLSTMVTITGVQTTKDLKTAKVFVSIFSNDSAKDVLAALNGASGFIRSKLFDRLKIRMVPYFTFLEDSSIEQGFKIEKILKELNVKGEDKNLDDQ
ncbi:MAG TPA: 30S ribosome-binding factor RbfA [Clostridia bacterium]|nr:30S ribosome-binding factor RbfA [Clostridia bacterium]